MLLAAIAWAFCLSKPLHGQTRLEDGKTFHFAGQTVTLKFPSPDASVAPAAQVAQWVGWQGLAGTSPAFDTPFVTAGSWSNIESAYPVSSPASGAVRWPLKIVVLANLDTLDEWPDGVLRARRTDIVGPDFLEVLDAIPQLVASVQVLSKGMVKIEPDVLIDPEASRDIAKENHPAFDSEYLRQYLAARVNGGVYEADDKIFRGPYAGILFITPASKMSSNLSDPRSRFVPKLFSVNGMPAASVPFYAVGGGSIPGSLAVALVNAWTALASQRFTECDAPPISGTLDRSDWSLAADLKLPALNHAIERTEPINSGDVRGVDLPLDIFTASFKSANVSLQVQNDSEKGAVLTYTEARSSRFGGFVLPHGTSAPDLQKTPVLSFSAKTTSSEPLAVQIVDGRGAAHWISIGRDRSVLTPNLPTSSSVPFSGDGSWHVVSINLHALGIDSVTRITIGASPADAIDSVPGTAVVYQFANFQWAASPSTESTAAGSPEPDPEARVMEAVKLGRAGAASAELRALLKDPNDQVLLNATAAYRNVVDPLAEPALGDLAFSPSGRVAEMALMALEYQKSPSASSLIERALRAGPEYSREVAGRLVGSHADPNSAQTLVVLLAGQSWHTRLAGAEALARLPGRQAALMRMAFLQQEDPIIKLAVVKSTDPKEHDDMQKLLWPAVNEPSDMVRAWSDIQLMRSPDPKFRSEGEKGVRDDSWWVRYVILEYMGAHPDEANRPSLRLALTDHVAAIRVAALRGLSALAEVTLDDLTPVLSDKNADVRQAIEACAGKHGLKLPTEGG